MNYVVLLGNLTRNPELKHLTSGTALAEFGIAVNENYKDKSGAKVEKVHFFDCVAWGRTGEVIAEYFQKGKKILIEGKLTFEQWEDKSSGAKRSKVRVNVQRFHFLPDGKGRDSNQDARQSMSGEENQAQPAWQDTDNGQDVPF